MNKATRKATFLAANPRCCYCNGERASEELDHMPARICFKDRQGPEDMVFPTCVLCNRAASQSEQVAAFHIRCTDFNDANFSASNLDKLATGVANNNRKALPVLLRGERAMEISPDARAHLHLFGTKALYAMFSRVSGKLAGPRHRRIVWWAQQGTGLGRELASWADARFGEMVYEARQNIDLGDQIRLQAAYNSAHGFLGLRMAFGQGLDFMCILGPSLEMQKGLDRPTLRYAPIRELGVDIRRGRYRLTD